MTRSNASGRLILGLSESLWGRLYIRDLGYETPCLVWTGTIASNGYGVITIAGFQHKVHRLVYEAVNGPMTRRDDNGKRIVSDHLCRNRPCACPTHIEPVTDALNVMRGISFAPVNASKTRCPRGHEYTPENTIFDSHGRSCRACKREKERERERAKRAVRPPRQKRSPKPKPPIPPRELAPCGTLAARLRHVRKGEPIDEACRAAHAERMRSWRRNQAS